MSLRFLLSRLLLAVLSLWGVSVLVFAILRMLPGDPALLMAPVGSTAEDLERIRREFGLTGSWWAQYGAFFLSLCQGNFGRSLWLQQDALRVILGRLPATLRLLGRLGIPDPAEVLQRYPHELSGGMRQRVLTAMAFSCEPTLVIADEPTTALDVTTQAQILRLLEGLQAEGRVATLFVTHDLGVVAHLAHRVGVMYAGCLVESAPTEELFRAAAHPYTQGLLAQVLRADVRAEASAALEGLMPVLAAPPRACPFRERCPKRMAACDDTMPALREVASGHSVACHLYEAA